MRAHKIAGALLSVLLIAPAFAEDKAQGTNGQCSSGKECAAGQQCHKGKHHKHHHGGGQPPAAQEQSK